MGGQTRRFQRFHGARRACTRRYVLRAIQRCKNHLQRMPGSNVGQHRSHRSDTPSVTPPSKCPTGLRAVGACFPFITLRPQSLAQNGGALELWWAWEVGLGFASLTLTLPLDALCHKLHNSFSHDKPSVIWERGSNAPNPAAAALPSRWYYSFNRALDRNCGRRGTT